MTTTFHIPQGPLVEADWLKAHAHHTIILDASIIRVPKSDGTTSFVPGFATFDSRHIQGARFADLFAAFSNPEAPFPFTIPTTDQLERAARTIGINNDSTLVIYDQLNGAYAARLWFVFLIYGFRGARVLNGGLRAWITAGGTTETGPASFVATKGDFTAAARADLLVDTPTVLKLVTSGDTTTHPLICGLRTAQFFSTGNADTRLGHIPGSRNLPYPDLIGPDGRLDAARTIRAVTALNLPPHCMPILYCGGGINAAGLALAMTAAQLPFGRLYDDSMSGWTADPTHPVARSDGPTAP